MLKFYHYNIILLNSPDGSVLQFSQEHAIVLEQNINSAGELLLMGYLNV